MGSRAVSLRRWAAPIMFAALGSGLAAGQTTDATISPQDCPKGAGLVVLVGQEDLHLNRDPRRASMGGSILKSILATALTGGSYLVGFHPGYDFGLLIPAPRDLTAGFQPPDVANALDSEFATTAAASRFERLTATTRGEDVDEAIWSTSCAKVSVINAQYSLERTREAVQLTLVVQLLEVPAKRAAEPATVGALEYRSAPLPFQSSNDSAAVAAALERLLAEERPTLVAYFQEAATEMAGMVANRLDAGGSGPPVATLAKSPSRRQLLCDGCDGSDKLLVEKPGRMWLQPEDQPLVIRSLPIVP